MLDWWATAIAGDSKFAKIFTRFSTKAGFEFPSVLLLPVSTAAAGKPNVQEIDTQNVGTRQPQNS